MPCDSGYLEPSSRERELQRAAKLLVYTLTALGRHVPAWARDDAADVYCRRDQSVIDLCAILREDAGQTDQLLYRDARNANARGLATWWEEHLAADREREARESAAAQREQTKRAALAKLTPEERAALGVNARHVDE